MAWKRGPLPPNTYGFGGVQTAACDDSGMYFADFRGDHVVGYSGSDSKGTRIEPNEVTQYDNSLELPPKL